MPESLSNTTMTIVKTMAAFSNRNPGYANSPQGKSAVAQIEKVGAMIFRSFYDADFHTTGHSHLVLDTGVIPVDRAATWIADAARLNEERSLTDALTT